MLFVDIREVSSVKRPGLFARVLILLSLVLSSCSSSTQQSSPIGISTQQMNDPYLGDANARVTIIEYGDFGCPTCRGWEKSGVLKEIRQKYGNQVKFVWRDFPVITPESPKAAEAAQCANDQGKFWEFHDLLYARAPALAVNDLKSYAKEINLDTARFNQCLDSGQKQAKVNQSEHEALNLGFRGTPDFLVNNKPIAGPISFESFQQMIDPLLK